MDASWFVLIEGGVRLYVKAKPMVRHDKIPRLVDIGNDRQALEVAVREPAQDGRANKGLSKALSDLFDIPKESISLEKGEKSKIKVFVLKGNRAALQKTLDALIFVPS